MLCCAGTPVPEGQAICYLSSCPMSDRNLKRDFVPVDPSDVLRRVGGLSISEWRYRTDSPEVRHVGPMAQDFQATFHVGDSDRYIHPVDADGVALAAIQGLLAELEQLRRSQRALERKNARLEQEIDRLRR